jgi:hypothetical protein
MVWTSKTASYINEQSDETTDVHSLTAEKRIIADVSKITNTKVNIQFNEDKPIIVEEFSELWLRIASLCRERFMIRTFLLGLHSVRC